ncbi:MAG: hypothetical protein CML66_26470 [Rhodobacteraceae bacterium]|nr:hypothetical protein [Paracoccaceae bacterium]MAY44187.1 hypothetical protein [Paracoccaceae bacterium]
MFDKTRTPPRAAGSVLASWSERPPQGFYKAGDVGGHPGMDTQQQPVLHVRVKRVQGLAGGAKMVRISHFDGPVDKIAAGRIDAVDLVADLSQRLAKANVGRVDHGVTFGRGRAVAMYGTPS